MSGESIDEKVFGKKMRIYQKKQAGICLLCLGGCPAMPVGMEAIFAKFVWDRPGVDPQINASHGIQNALEEGQVA